MKCKRIKCGGDQFRKFLPGRSLRKINCLTAYMTVLQLGEGVAMYRNMGVCVYLCVYVREYVLVCVCTGVCVGQCISYYAEQNLNLR